MKQTILLSMLLCSIITTAQPPKKSCKEHDDAVEQAKNLTDYNCYTCNDDDVIIYDFNCKSFWRCDGNNYTKVSHAGLFKAKHNKQMKIKIININRYIYNVNLNVDNVEFGSEPNILFTELFTGTGNLLEGLITTNKNNDNTVLDTLVTAITEFKKEYDNLIENNLKAYTIGETFDCKKQNKPSYASLSSKLADVRYKYVEIHGKIAEILAERDKLKKVHTECAAANDLYKKKKEEIDKAKEADKKKLEEELKKMKDCDAVASEKELTNYKIDFRTDYFDAIKTKIDRLLNIIGKPAEEQLMKTVLFNSNMLAQHMSYTSPPIYPQGNRLHIGIGIGINDSSVIKKWNIMPHYNDSFALNIPVIWKPYISFSSGPFMGLYNHLNSDRYEWQRIANANNLVTDTSTYRLVAAGHTKLPLGIAAFANMGTKFSGWGGFGASVGVGVTLEEKVRPIYMGGVSLFLGNEHQFNITYGVSIAQTERLRSDYNVYLNTGTEFTDKPADVQYGRELGIGQFISINYTLFNPGNHRGLLSNSR